MTAYADSSVLVSLFHADTLSPKVWRWFERADPVCHYTALHRLEVRNQLRRLRRASGPWGEAAWGALRASEGVNGRLRAATVNLAATLAQADLLSERHAPTLKLAFGAMDAWHVAAAVALGPELFLTGDKGQAALAERAGLKVKLFSAR